MTYELEDKVFFLAEISELNTCGLSDTVFEISEKTCEFGDRVFDFSEKAYELNSYLRPSPPLTVLHSSRALEDLILSDTFECFEHK